MLDQFNRNINYARISLTDACNLSCTYCKPVDLKANPNLITYKEYQVIIDALDDLNFTKVRFTGGEPLLYKELVSLVAYTNTKSNITDIGITTNGLLLDKYLDDLIKAGLKRINISLDTLNNTKYQELTKSDKLDIVLKNIKLAQAKGLKVKINTVLLKTINGEEIQTMINYAHLNNLNLRFIELMPMNLDDTFYHDNFISSKELITKLDAIEVASRNEGVTKRYQLPNKQEFGLISPLSNHFCESCNRIRITSMAHLRLCLHNDNEIDLKELLKNKEELVNYISKVITNKPEKHYLNEKQNTKTNMSKIGG